MEEDTPGCLGEFADILLFFIMLVLAGAGVSLLWSDLIPTLFPELVKAGYIAESINAKAGMGIVAIAFLTASPALIAIRLAMKDD